MKRSMRNEQVDQRKRRKVDGEKKVGRPPSVPSTVAIGLFKKYMKHLEGDNLPPYSSQIWKKMSKELNGKWSAHAV